MKLQPCQDMYRLLLALILCCAGQLQGFEIKGHNNNGGGFSSSYSSASASSSASSFSSSFASGNGADLGKLAPLKATAFAAAHADANAGAGASSGAVAGAGAGSGGARTAFGASGTGYSGPSAGASKSSPDFGKDNLISGSDAGPGSQFKPSGGSSGSATPSPGTCSSCKGPFPGPQGSIYDSKPAPPGGGGPDPAWLQTPAKAPHTSSTVITAGHANAGAVAGTTGLSYHLVHSLPGAQGSIHDSKPATSGGCGPSNPNCGGSYPHTSGTASNIFPGSPGTIYNSKPVAAASPTQHGHAGASSGAQAQAFGGSASGCGPSNPTCSQTPAGGSSGGSHPQNVDTASNIFPGSPGTIYSNKPVSVSAHTQPGHAGAQAQAIGGSASGCGPGNLHCNGNAIPRPGYNGAGSSSGGCEPSNPNCSQTPAGGGVIGGGSTGTGSNIFPGSPGTIYSSRPVSTGTTSGAQAQAFGGSSSGCGAGNPHCNGNVVPKPGSGPHTQIGGGSGSECGPVNPNCSGKPGTTGRPVPTFTVPGPQPGSFNNKPGGVPNSVLTPQDGVGCGPSNPNCSGKPTSGTYVASGAVANSGSSSSSFGCGSSNPNCDKPSAHTPSTGLLPSPQEGNIYGTKPFTSPGCGPADPSCQPTYPVVSYGQVTGTGGSGSGTYTTTGTFPGTSGSVYVSKPVPANDCGPSNPNCKPTYPSQTIVSSSGVNGCSPSDPHCSVKPSSYTPGSAPIGSFPGPSGSIYDSKPAPVKPIHSGGSYSQTAAANVNGCSPSNPNCANKPSPYTPGSAPTGSFPGPSGSIYDSKPAPASGCGPSNPNCKPAHPGGSYGQTSGAVGTGCSPADPHCSGKPNTYTVVPAPSGSTPDSNIDCGPSNPNCSGKTGSVDHQTSGAAADASSGASGGKDMDASGTFAMGSFHDDFGFNLHMKPSHGFMDGCSPFDPHCKGHNPHQTTPTYNIKPVVETSKKCQGTKSSECGTELVGGEAEVPEWNKDDLQEKPQGCLSGNCGTGSTGYGATGSQTGGAGAGFATGSVTISKKDGSVSTTGDHSHGCTNGNCGTTGTGFGLPGSIQGYGSGSGKGFATGSVTIEKKDGTVTSTGDGCSNGDCGSSGAGSGASAGTYGTSHGSGCAGGCPYQGTNSNAGGAAFAHSFSSAGAGAGAGTTNFAFPGFPTPYVKGSGGGSGASAFSSAGSFSNAGAGSYSSAGSFTKSGYSGAMARSSASS